MALRCFVMYLPLRLPEGGKTIELPERSYDLAMHPYPPYEIQPEYGSYYSNFRTIPGLRQHLADVPGHKVKFCEQQDKAIAPVADTSCAHHRCRDCGMGHLSRQFRDRHYQRFRHVRDHKEHSKVSVRRRRASRTGAPSAPRTSAGFSYV